jgi:hypothetical protein
MDCARPLGTTAHANARRCPECRERHRHEYHAYRYATQGLPQAADLPPDEITRRYTAALARIRASRRHRLSDEDAWGMPGTYWADVERMAPDVTGCGIDALRRPGRERQKPGQAWRGPGRREAQR